MLSAAEQNVLSTYWDTLEQDFPYDALLPKLISNKILDRYDRGPIESQASIELKNRELLKCVEKKPAGTFTLICELYSKLTTLNSGTGLQLLQEIANAKSCQEDATDSSSKTADQSNVQTFTGTDNEIITVVDPDSSANIYIDRSCNIPNCMKEVNWNTLTTSLGFQEYEVKQTRRKFNNPSMLLRALLNKWYSDKKAVANKVTLVRVLYFSGLKDVAKDVAKIFEKDIQHDSK